MRANSRALACTCRAFRPIVRPSPVRKLHLDAAQSIPSTSAAPPPPPLSTRAKKSSSKDRWPGWTPVIGLELHVQLKGNVKMLSSALAAYDDSPNTHVALFDAALPGSLPRLGAEPVRLALLACLALKSNINPASTFDRKHYFYPDLPAGFQVTQKYSPLAKGGSVRIRHEIEGRSHTFDVRIDQIQLEQDTAKSSHDPTTGLTLVDLNRAGAALVEIVTQPDMSTPEEAAAFVRQLQSILRHVGASDANMEKGELRCDVNVSVRRTDAPGTFGSRCEVKNLNGVRFLAGAIESEVARQIAELESGGTVQQATRGFNAVTGETYHLRSKEDAPDYRYMPDPELGALVITESQLSTLRAALPELPDEAFERIQSEYGLSPREAAVLVALGEGAEDVVSGSAGAGVKYFEDVARGRDSKLAANWFIHELLGQLGKAHIPFLASPVRPDDLGLLVDAVANGKLTGTVAKKLLASFISDSSTPMSSLVASQIDSAPSATDIDALCQKVVEDLPVEAEKVRAGQKKVLMRLVGEVMKRSSGKGDARKIKETLERILV